MGEKTEKRTHFDYTMMSAYQRCQRKFYYRHQRGLVGKKARMYAPEFGRAIHLALDRLYVDWDVVQAVAHFKANYEENLEEDPKRTHKMGEWIIKNYAKTYQDQPHKIVHAEMSFDLPLGNGNSLIGRIDKVVEWGGTLWIMDHKTTSQMGANFYKEFDPSLQMTGYVWAARELGFDVRGVLIDAILVAKGLLESSSRSRLNPLARFDFYKNDAALKEWKDTVLQIQTDIGWTEEDARINGPARWTPNFDSCTYYGECPYRRVCSEEEQVRERLISMDYDVDFWDPREKEEVK